MKKLMAVLLSLTLAFLLVGSVPAAKAEDRMSVPVSGETREMKEPEPLEEITELRTVSSKTYKLSDGGCRYVAYAGPIHYLDSDGKYREIDTSLVASRASEYLYTNAANSWNVSFGENEIKLTIKDQSIVFSLPERNATSVQPAKEMTGRKDEYFAEKKNADNAIVYSYNGFDVVFSVLTGALQEDIVISNRNALQDFSFTIRLSEGLQVTDKEGLRITDKNGEDIFRFTQPYMYDANGNMSEAVTLDCTSTDEGSTVSIRPDNSFFNEETAYPVVVVPRSSLPTTPASKDTCVDEGYPNMCYYDAVNLWTGGAAGVNRKRTFIQFNLPTTINSSQITRARIRLKKNKNEIPNIYAFPIDQPWSDEDVTWNDQPTYLTGNWSSASVSEGNDWYSVDVTDTICYYMLNSSWYFGFCLKETQESNSAQKTRFYSSEATAGNRPELCVDYVNSLGSRPFQYTNSILINGTGYALDLALDLSWVELGYTPGSFYGKTVAGVLSTVQEMLEGWMDDSYGFEIEYQALTNYDSNIYLYINPPGWYRVALRAGFVDSNNNGVLDPCETWGWHMWYQTNDYHGVWAEKHGYNTSQIISGSNGRNPYVLNWNRDGYVYNSDCKYYQIKEQLIPWN